MNARTVAIAGCMGVLAGCAAAPRVAPIDSGSPVAFVVVKSEPAHGADALRNTAVSKR